VVGKAAGIGFALCEGSINTCDSLREVLSE
jgi:hypothetical protein